MLHLHRPLAETIVIPERIIAAPAGGVFRPAPPEHVTTEGEVLHAGQVVGTIGDTPATAVSVLSPFTGFFMGLLAHDGERVRPGQPLAWLRATS